MKTIAVIQARTGSTRLPGKVFADIAGRTMLERVTERTRRAALVDEIWIATTTEPADDVIASWCSGRAIPVYRGSVDDVLSRYAAIARQNTADAIVRITSDCPMIDPDVIDAVVADFHRGGADYVSNTLVRSWPRGLDVETIRPAALLAAGAEAEEDYERAHVTAFLYRRPERFVLRNVPGPDRGDARWTVDTPADLELVRAMYAALGEDFTWEQALALYDSRPDIAALNAGVEQKPLEAG